MSSNSIDPRKLLGYRIVAQASDAATSIKLGDKVGSKDGKVVLGAKEGKGLLGVKEGKVALAAALGVKEGKVTGLSLIAAKEGKGQ